MASDKPQKITKQALRKQIQQACRETPCTVAQQWIDGDKSSWPSCILCCHENRFKEK